MSDQDQTEGGGLKECPFCGNKMERSRMGDIQGHDDDCAMSEGWITIPDTIWNTRTPPAGKAVTVADGEDVIPSEISNIITWMEEEYPKDGEYLRKWVNRIEKLSTSPPVAYGEGLRGVKSEALDRMKYFYLQTSGEYKFPNSAEGDLLRICKKEIEATPPPTDDRVAELVEAAKMFFDLFPKTDETHNFYDIWNNLRQALSHFPSGTAHDSQGAGK